MIDATDTIGVTGTIDATNIIGVTDTIDATGTRKA
jgi:hypothetical protein